MDKIEEVDQHIADLRKRIEAAERVREAIAGDPELLIILQRGEKSDKPDAVANGLSRPRKDSNKPTKGVVRGGAVAQKHFKTVAEYLEGENEPKTIPEIATAVGLKPSNVIQICYRTHKPLFDQLPVEGHKTRKRWRLKKGWRQLLEKATEG